jgi:hypothetical protein
MRIRLPTREQGPVQDESSAAATYRSRGSNRTSAAQTTDRARPHLGLAPAPEQVEFREGDQSQDEKLKEQPHQPREQFVRERRRFLLRASEVIAGTLQHNAPATQHARPLAKQRYSPRLIALAPWSDDRSPGEAEYSTAPKTDAKT